MGLILFSARPVLEQARPSPLPFLKNSAWTGPFIVGQAGKPVSPARADL